MAEMTDDIDIYDDDDVDLVRHHREAGRGRDGGCFAFREGERGEKTGKEQLTLVNCPLNSWPYFSGQQRWGWRQVS